MLQLSFILGEPFAGNREEIKWQLESLSANTYRTVCVSALRSKACISSRSTYCNSLVSIEGPKLHRVALGLIQPGERT